MKNFTIKTVLLTASLLLGLVCSISSLYGKDRTHKIAVRSVGYYYISKYKIHPISHTDVAPLDVHLWLGRGTLILKTHEIGYRNLFAQGLKGKLFFTIDNKPARIEFQERRSHKLTTQKKHIHTSSMWYVPLNRIMRVACQCDNIATKSGGFSGLPHLGRARWPFRIRSYNDSVMYATYVLGSQTGAFYPYQSRVVKIAIKKEEDAERKTSMIVATATFTPYWKKTGVNTEFVLRYIVTKTGIREYEQKHVNAYHGRWLVPVKKAVERSVKQYFMLKRAVRAV